MQTILLNHGTPFSLAHGGVTNIVHRTHDVLVSQGFNVEYLRWWDPDQKGDVLFHFGRPTVSLVKFAKASGYIVVAEHVMTGLVSRPAWQRAIQKRAIAACRRFLPKYVSGLFNWDIFDLLDMNFFPSAWDAEVAAHMFDVRPDKSTVLPYGVNDAFLQSKEVAREGFLITTATITPRKRVMELAKACDTAQVPLKVVGKPYAQSDSYFDEFKALEASSDYVEHIPHIANQSELASLYRRARGFVLISAMETISQSAIEAAACRCPLLLSDMDWAHRSFSDNASYCPITNSTSRTARSIINFYDNAPARPSNWVPPSWSEARQNLSAVFEELSRHRSAFSLSSEHM